MLENSSSAAVVIGALRVNVRCCQLSLRHPGAVDLGEAGFSKLFSMEVRKFTVSTKLSRVPPFVILVIHFYCIVIAISEFVAIET